MENRNGWQLPKADCFLKMIVYNHECLKIDRIYVEFSNTDQFPWVVYDWNTCTCVGGDEFVTFDVFYLFHIP